MKKSWILCLALLSSQSVMAKFNFKLWRGVEKIIKDKDPAAKPEEVHPFLGKLYYDVIKNLRMGEELYTPHPEGRGKDEIKETEYKDFAILLKELFPSNGGFTPNESIRPAGKLTARMIGGIIRWIRNNDDEDLEEKIVNCLNVPIKEENKIIKTDNEQIDKEIENLKASGEYKKYLEDIKNANADEKKSITEKYKKITEEVKEKTNKKKQQKNEYTKNNLPKDMKNFSIEILKSVNCLKTDGILPHNLTELAFLTYFWEKFGNQKDGQDKKDMEEFLRGLTGSADLTLQNQDIETIEEINSVLSGHKGNFEQSARALEYGDEALNIFAYPNNHSFGEGSSVPYKITIKQNGKLEEQLIDKFSNCVEHSLFCLFDLIFYTQDKDSKGFKTSIKESALGKFYEQRGERGANTDQESKWNNVIQNLDLKDSSGKSLEKEIVYNRNKDGICFELKPGLIRLMHLFKEISNYPEAVPFTKEDLEKKLEESLKNNKDEVIKECKTWLEKFFNHIAPDGRTFEVQVDKIGLNDSHGPDYTGTVAITMKNKENEKLCEWEWNLMNAHGRCQNLKIYPKFFNQDYENSKKQFSSCVTFDSLNSDPKNLFLRLFRNLKLNLNLDETCHLYENQNFLSGKLFSFDFLKEVFAQKKEFFEKHKNQLLTYAIKSDFDKAVKFIKYQNLTDIKFTKTLDYYELLSVILGLTDKNFSDFWAKNSNILSIMSTLDVLMVKKLMVVIAGNENIALENVQLSNLKNITNSDINEIILYLRKERFKNFWINNKDILNKYKWDNFNRDDYGTFFSKTRLNINLDLKDLDIKNINIPNEECKYFLFILFYNLYDKRFKEFWEKNIEFLVTTHSEYIDQEFLNQYPTVFLMVKERLLNSQEINDDFKKILQELIKKTSDMHEGQTSEK